MQITQKRLPKLLVKFGASLFLLISIVACEWGDRTISLIKPDTDDLQVVYADTVTINLSTVLKDSLMTTFGSGSSLLTGWYKDDISGEIDVKSFGLPQLYSSIGIDSKAVYDSIVFASAYNYTYGDTNQVVKLAVHPLIDDISKDTYYNTSSSAYEPSPIGSKEFKPTPTTNRRSFRLKLNDEFGQMLFNAGLQNKLRTQDELMALFKGFALVSNQRNTAGFLGLLSDSTRIVLHYHQDGADGNTKYQSEIRLAKAYNKIDNNRTGSYLSDLKESKVSVPYNASNNHTVIQAGAGLMTRIDMPYLHDLKFDNGKILINRAFLRVNLPREVPNRQAPVPAGIGLYSVGKNNIWETSNSPMATGAYVHDLINNERYYRIDISSYVVQAVASGIQSSNGFLIAPMRGNASQLSLNMVNSLDRLVLDGRRPIELQLYFTQLNDK